MTRILIAEDDPLISAFIEKGLRANGFATSVADDGARATELGLTDAFDLLILDLALPEREGFQVLQDLRRRGRHLPVLVLTGRPELRDAVACLDVGADDYMTKPFRFEELLARVRVRLRAPGTEEPTELEVGSVHLDLRTRRVTLSGREVALTGREYRLLEVFMRHPDQVLSREQLLSHAWGYELEPGTNVVNVFVSALRKKLGDEAIESVRGVGYRLRLR
ncbi:MAG TPA: response regulator transcription factor [Acidimicrobiales bacterium]|nr:response regulator transcription factor [Acidimicrobiales bacterium]